MQGVGSTCARDGCCKRCARVMWGQRLGGGGVHVSCGSTLEPKKQGKRAFRGPCIVMGQTGHCHVMWCGARDPIGKKGVDPTGPFLHFSQGGGPYG